MKEGPDISRIAAMIGDPARANMLAALLGGQALTAGELAVEAGVMPSTASDHLRQLAESGLVWPRKQGRHRYFQLADETVAEALETLAGLAAAKDGLRTRPGPRDAALRTARLCYDHMAGARAVQMFDSLADRGFLQVRRDSIDLTRTGVAFAETLGIDVSALKAGRRPLCRVCLDWSERRSHLSGALGKALMQRVFDLGWAHRTKASRSLVFTPPGLAAFEKTFPR